jgi:hypothetical protein
MRSNGEESTSVDEALTSTAGTTVAIRRDGQQRSSGCESCRLSAGVVCEERVMSKSFVDTAVSNRVSAILKALRYEISTAVKLLDISASDARSGWAGISQPPLRRLIRFDEATASNPQHWPMLSWSAQLIGHKSSEGLATPTSTGVASRPKQLLRALLARRPIGQQDLSRRGNDNEVSHVLRPLQLFSLS